MSNTRRFIWGHYCKRARLERELETEDIFFLIRRALREQSASAVQVSETSLWVRGVGGRTHYEVQPPGLMIFKVDNYGPGGFVLEMHVPPDPPYIVLGLLALLSGAVFLASQNLLLGLAAGLVAACVIELSFRRSASQTYEQVMSELRLGDVLPDQQ